MIKKQYILFFLLLVTGVSSVTSQILDIGDKKKLIEKRGDGRTFNGRSLNDTINGNKFEDEIDIELSAKTHYTDYKIISYEKDTVVIDTTLSLKKERIFNYIRKNSFELMPFHNQGQTFSNLGYDFNKTQLLPDIGYRAKFFNFYKIEDIKYYRVPTPTSELFFKTGIQQGQMLNSYLASNLSPQLNVSISYKGLRSLGDYRNALSSHQNFRVTTSYETKNKHYQARIHYAANNIFNEENGGLTIESIELFTADNPDFRDRERLETVFTNAESSLKSKRYYLEHAYNIWQRKDSVSSNTSHLQVGHEFVHSRKFYNYDQDAANTMFGTAYQNVIQDSVFDVTTDNALYLELKSPYVLGKLRAKINYNTYNYGYENVLYLDNQTIPARLKGHNISFLADWKAQLKSFALQAKSGVIMEGDFKGNYLSGTASITKDSLFVAKATLMLQSQSPNLNFLLHQSDYINYNWYTNFDNENTRFLGFNISSDKFFDADVSITQKDNYTYFDENAQPRQYTETLNYLKAKLHKAVNYKKFTFDNTIMYQKVASGGDIFRVPEWITENTLYYTDYVFKGDPLLLQAGVNFKYFTKYKANEFNPLLNEFSLQNNKEIGEYPMIDLFVNGQIRRTRLFLKAENLSSLWDRGAYFVTPTHVYRDFTIRFGLVWNFFI